MYIAFYKRNHSHGVILITKWNTFLSIGLCRVENGITWAFQDGGLKSEPSKINLKNVYWFCCSLDQVQRPARKWNKLPAIMSNSKLVMRILIAILRRYSFLFENTSWNIEDTTPRFLLFFNREEPSLKCTG